jgi:hypothetical protein
LHKLLTAHFAYCKVGYHQKIEVSDLLFLVLPPLKVIAALIALVAPAELKRELLK